MGWGTSKSRVLVSCNPGPRLGLWRVTASALAECLSTAKNLPGEGGGHTQPQRKPQVATVQPWGKPPQQSWTADWKKPQKDHWLSGSLRSLPNEVSAS